MPNPLSGSTDMVEKICKHLDLMQQREVQKDTGHGIRSAREIGLAVGLPTKEVRVILTHMAEQGLVLRLDYDNGLFWRSKNPLPWESGGELAEKYKREQEMWKGPLTLIVQAVCTHGVVRDIKAYPEGLRLRAEAHVTMENSRTSAQRADDYFNNRHLNNNYIAPPRYRLVSLL